MGYAMAEVPDSSWGGLEGIRHTTGATSRPKIVWPLKPTAVATTLKELVVVATTRKELAIVATTARHQQLLGTVPQPSRGKAVAPQPPASQPPPPKDADMAQPHGNDDNDDDNVDVDAFLNTGACSKDLYMHDVDEFEEPFRAHGDNPGRPTTCTQRLVFQGFSQQDTPPEAGDPALAKPANIFSPTTLHKAVNEKLAPPAPPKMKKHRKRRRGASASQPAQLLLRVSGLRTTWYHPVRMA